MAADIEKKNLEAHVEMCATRYGHLEKRLSIIEEKVETIIEVMTSGNKTMQKVIIGATGTIIAGLLSTIVTLLMKL